MSSVLLAFIAIVLFMIHEFEEMIFVCPWIAKKENDPKFAREMFILGKNSYPSAETMAVLILEEFLLASLILLVGILFSLPELVLAITLGHTIHLFAHIAQAARFRTWVPGSITAVTTMPLLIGVIMMFCFSQTLNWLFLLIETSLIFFFLLLNLDFLHKQAAKIESFLHS